MARPFAFVTVDRRPLTASHAMVIKTHNQAGNRLIL
jgi:hypothetical protein